MPQYTFKELGNGKVDILENGTSIAKGGPGFTAEYAKTLGYKPPMPPTALQLSPIQNPVPAATLSPAQGFQLPEVKAPDVQRQYTESLAANVQTARTALESSYKKQQAEVDRKIADLKKQEADIIAKQGELSQPFRQQLEDAERQRLYVNENFEANQKLTNELETLLNEGNALISGERNRFASRASIAAGVARTIDDVNARRGVIEAVLSARNSQIGQAYTMIDRSVAAITADRKDSLAYYDTLLSLNNQGQLKLNAESKALAEEQTALLKEDLDRAEQTAEAVKQAMIDPDMALTYAQAGITLLDTPEQINTKLAEYGYAKEVRDLSNEMASAGYALVIPGQAKPAGAHVVTMTDSKGVQRQYYAKPSTTGSGSGSSSGAIIPADTPDYLMNVIRNSKGGKALTGDQTTPLTKASIVLNQVAELANTIGETSTGPILGILRDKNPYDVKARLLSAQLRSTVPNLARGIYGEVGVLTDTDIANYIQTLPNVRTPEEANNLVLSMTIKTIMNSMGSQLESLAASGRDVSGYENIYNRMKELSDSLVPQQPALADEDKDAAFREVVEGGQGGFIGTIKSFFGGLFGD